ncbi:hotdog domain-containing protein [Gordonia insulae]|uniref:Thioesterase domain-containing protein n=1 Tax=Gordonia insulae TaxID=2420509 RepID=A0A3G8JNH1_9ACTN|nr:hotdog domain-containing protein [Gordonia insulae]AZG46631.1 hypothetical protein D7316_03232 [Gordonia insulae]
MSTTTAEFVVSGAEALLRVSPVTLGSDRGELAVEAGGWLNDPVAGSCRGALGVPLDDVTGYVVAAGSGTDRWPVSLGIRLDFLADPPIAGPPMTVTGELIARDDLGGTTRGVVADASGRPIALVTQRSHLVEVATRPSNSTVDFELPAGEVTVRDALGFRDITAGIVELSPTPLAANGMGNVHGGVLICGSEFAAMSALDAGGVLRTSSIDIAYVRPGDAASMTSFEAEVVHRGRSLAVVRVNARSSTGKLCAVANVVVQR